MIKRLIHGWHWILILFLILASFLASNLSVLSFAFSPVLPQSLLSPIQQIKPEIIHLDPGIISSLGMEKTRTFTPTPFFISMKKAAFFASPTSSSTPFQPLPPTPTHTLTPTPTATFTPSPSPSPTPTDTATPIPTATYAPVRPTSPPVSDPGSSDFPPSSAFVSGVPGHNMYYSLDCETRSAVDLAAFFGVSIDHQTFLNNLPYTDDPETGYVGSYSDPAGNIPPYSYGVHSPPVATLLNQYGLKAQNRKGMSIDQLKEEIASGRPVMVWVIGSVQYGTPQTYTAESTGNTTTVAAYEHTVLVVGYDEYYIYIQDGYNSYYRSINQFTASWGVLGNMAVTAKW